MANTEFDVPINQDLLTVSIGGILKSAYDEWGGSLQQLAAKSGLELSASSLSGILNGKQRVTVYQLLSILTAFNISTSVFFEKLSRKLTLSQKGGIRITRGKNGVYHIKM